MVKSVMNVLTEDYINPFQVDVDKQRLVCLSSGVPARVEIADSLPSIEEMGAKQHKDFLEKEIQSNTSFHQPTRTNKVLGFKSMAKMTFLKNGRKSIKVNRDILANLFSISLNRLQKSLKIPIIRSATKLMQQRWSNEKNHRK